MVNCIHFQRRRSIGGRNHDELARLVKGQQVHQVDSLTYILQRECPKCIQVEMSIFG